MAYHDTSNRQHNGLYPDIQNNQPGLEVKVEQSPQLVPEHVYAYPQVTHDYQPNTNGAGQWQAPSAKTDPDSQKPLEGPGDAKRRVLGLTVPVFWALVIGLVLITAGAIAGGVAGGLSAQQRSSNSADTTVGTSSASSTTAGAVSATATPTATTGSGTATSATIATGSASPSPTDGGCPSINGTTYTPLNSTGGPIATTTEGDAMSFVEVCDMNWPAGEGNGNAGVVDIMSLYLPSLEDCMTACAQYNVGHAANGGESTGYCGSVAILKAVQ